MADHITGEASARTLASGWAVRSGLVGVISVGIVASMIPLRTHVANTNLALLLVLVILAAAVIDGRGAGLIAAISCAIAYDFFLTRPYGSLTIAKRDDIVTTVLLVAVGAISGELVERARRHALAAAETGSELARIHRRSELAAGGEAPGRLIRLAGEELAELFDLKSWKYRPGLPPIDLPVLGHDSIHLPSDRDLERRGQLVLPVKASGVSIGYFVLVFPTTSVGVSVPVAKRQAAVLVADQLAVALSGPKGRGTHID